MVKKKLIMVIFCVAFACTKKQGKLNEDANKKEFFKGKVEPVI